MAAGKWHEVRQGDSVENIAVAAGHFWETVWNHPENATLREDRKSPHALRPGDRVFVPEVVPKTASGSTGQTHRFRIKGIPCHFRMRFEIDGEPRANETYEIDIDGELRSGQTDGDGVLEETISPTTRKIRVLFDTRPPEEAADPTFEGDPEPEEEPADSDPEADKDVYVFWPRHLDPSGYTRGAQARLSALGYGVGKLDDELGDRTRDALRSFQEDRGLEPTGELDDATSAALAEDIPG